MTVTVHDIVIRAHRKIGVVAQDEEMTADQGRAGQDAFNEMVHAWALHGIALSPAFADKALTDDFPLADKYREGTIYLLASRLAPEYVMPATFDAGEFFRKIQADLVAVPAVSIDSALLRIGRYPLTGLY